MNHLTKQIVVVATLLVATGMLFAQARGRVSPHETINGRIDGSLVTITYGRPYSKDPKTGEIRKVWGTLVPYSKAWRLGSDEATTLLLQKAIEIGGTTVEPGAYTIYLVPEENGGKLAISKTLGGWGIPVDEKNDLARVDVKKEAVDTQVDQFAMAIDRNPAGGGIIKMTWEKATYSVPFTMKK